jgi:hypothetical protein
VKRRRPGTKLGTSRRKRRFRVVRGAVKRDELRFSHLRLRYFSFANGSLLVVVCLSRFALQRSSDVVHDIAWSALSRAVVTQKRERQTTTRSEPLAKEK